MRLRKPRGGEVALLADVVRTVNQLRAQLGEPPAEDATEALLQAGVWLMNTVAFQAAIEAHVTMAERGDRRLDS